MGILTPIFFYPSSRSTPTSALIHALTSLFHTHNETGSIA
jgi:hypothetical protein